MKPHQIKTSITIQNLILRYKSLIPGEITRLMKTKIQLYKITFMKIDFLLVRSVRTPLAIETALRQRACIQKHFPSYWELFSFQDDYFDMPPVSVKHRLLFKADRKLQSKRNNETQSQLSQVRNTTHLWLHKIERILSTLMVCQILQHIP